MSSSPPLQTFFDTLPKVELHRHLEGSVRLETLKDIIRSHPEAELPSLENIAARARVTPADTLTPANFLSKFMALRNFYLSPEIIQRIAYEAVMDAAAEGIRYLELRFTPTSLARLKGFPLNEVMDWVSESCQKASRQAQILTRLIVSYNRHDSVEQARQVIQLAMDRRSRGIVGIDLAGNEADFPIQPFLGLLHEIRRDGMQITIHAGEWGGAQNVRQAILELDARRIGHGVRVIEDDDVVALARERGVVFEVCPSSNLASGVVASLKDHPLPKMVEASLKFTLNTDDPAICNARLGEEYTLAHQTMGISKECLLQANWTALEASFLTDREKQELSQILKSHGAESAS